MLSRRTKRKKMSSLYSLSRSPNQGIQSKCNVVEKTTRYHLDINKMRLKEMIYHNKHKILKSRRKKKQRDIKKVTYLIENMAEGNKRATTSFKLITRYQHSNTTCLYLV
jgi:hypothetical protein